MSGENDVGSRFTRPSSPALRTRHVAHRALTRYQWRNTVYAILNSFYAYILILSYNFGLTIQKHLLIMTFRMPSKLPDKLDDLPGTRLRGTTTDSSARKILVSNKLLASISLLQLFEWFKNQISILSGISNNSGCECDTRNIHHSSYIQPMTFFDPFKMFQLYLPVNIPFLEFDTTTPYQDTRPLEVRFSFV